MSYSERQRGELLACIDHLEAVVKLASANFPGNSDLRVETVGASSHASMVMPSWALSMLLKAARNGLEARGAQS